MDCHGHKIKLPTITPLILSLVLHLPAIPPEFFKILGGSSRVDLGARMGRRERGSMGMRERGRRGRGGGGRGGGGGGGGGTRAGTGAFGGCRGNLEEIEEEKRTRW